MTHQRSGLFGPAGRRDALRVEAEAQVGRAVSMMARARELVLSDRVRTVGLLNARRQALAGHLQAYQQFKHRYIFDPVVSHGPPSSRVVARAMKVDCLELGAEFAGYHARWLRLEGADWAEYRHDMLATVDTLSFHLRAELRAMQQLLMISDLYGGAPPVPVADPGRDLSLIEHCVPSVADAG